jgi:hypothetical protein
VSYTEVARWGNRERHVLLLELRLSRHCHSSRGKTLKNRKQKVNTEEKLALAVDRNCLILLGKLPLRQIVIKLLKWLLTECWGDLDCAPTVQESDVFNPFELSLSEKQTPRFVGNVSS